MSNIDCIFASSLLCAFFVLRDVSPKPRRERGNDRERVPVNITRNLIQQHSPKPDPKYSHPKPTPIPQHNLTPNPNIFAPRPCPTFHVLTTNMFFPLILERDIEIERMFTPSSNRLETSEEHLADGSQHLIC